MKVPTLQEVRDWTALTQAAISDDLLDGVRLSELEVQARTCWLGTPDQVADPNAAYPADLRQALYRRCARQVAARSIPLGLVDSGGEYTPARVPTWDAEITRLEASRRIVAVA